MDCRLLHFLLITGTLVLLGVVGQITRIIDAYTLAIALVASTGVNFGFLLQLTRIDAHRSAGSTEENLTDRAIFPVLQFFVVGMVFGGTGEFCSYVLDNRQSRSFPISED
jgi:hypothetical protein